MQQMTLSNYFLERPVKKTCMQHRYLCTKNPPAPPGGSLLASSITAWGDSIMQSTKPQGARAKTSTPRTSSTAKEDKPQHTTISIDGMECNSGKANQPQDGAHTQSRTSSPTTNQENPTAPQANGTNPQKRTRSLILP